MIVFHTHHGTTVAVQAHLNGKHKQHCLCYQGCMKFKPGTPENCPIAQATFENCVKFDIVTPVWECPSYEHSR